MIGKEREWLRGSLSNDTSYLSVCIPADAGRSVWELLMHSNRRAMAQALVLVRRLYRATRDDASAWCSVNLIVNSREHADALQYAMEQHWIEASPRADIRLTDEGRRMAR